MAKQEAKLSLVATQGRVRGEDNGIKRGAEKKESWEIVASTLTKKYLRKNRSRKYASDQVHKTSMALKKSREEDKRVMQRERRRWCKVQGVDVKRWRAGEEWVEGASPRCEIWQEVPGPWASWAAGSKVAVAGVPDRVRWSAAEQEVPSRLQCWPGRRSTRLLRGHFYLFTRSGQAAYRGTCNSMEVARKMEVLMSCASLVLQIRDLCSRGGQGAAQLPQSSDAVLVTWLVQILSAEQYFLKYSVHTLYISMLHACEPQPESHPANGASLTHAAPISHRFLKLTSLPVLTCPGWDA